MNTYYQQMPNVIELNNVRKRFSKTDALQGLDLEVKEGAITGLLGANGSGKTTSLRIALGLHLASSGDVELFGRSPGDRDFYKSVRLVGALIEKPVFYDRLSAIANLKIHAEAIGADKSQIPELLEIVDLSGAAKKRSGSFSLGMRQRLGVALALLGEPRLVVLDEPTNGLDPEGIIEFREMIRRLPERGLTVLVSSHILSEVQLFCDQVTIIDLGKTVTSGPIEKILKQSGERTSYQIKVSDLTLGEKILSAKGLKVQTEADRLVVQSKDDINPSEINKTLAESGLWLSELHEEKMDLETAFIKLINAEQQVNPNESVKENDNKQSSSLEKNNRKVSDES